MNPPPGEDGQLASLLRAIPAPEPPPDFVAGARRRYRDAIEARYRRKIFMSLAGALLGLVVVATLLGPTAEPALLVAWLAEAMAQGARWMTGVAVVLLLVPPDFWAPATLGLVASVLSLVLLARPHSLAVVKYADRSAVLEAKGDRT
jgi:hypothetical protein